MFAALGKARGTEAWLLEQDEEREQGGRAANSAGKRSNGWGEGGFFGRGFDDGSGHLAAFAALRGNAQFAADIGKRAGTAGQGFPDLAVGYGFAEADVHGGFGVELICLVGNVMVMRINVNKE